MKEKFCHLHLHSEYSVLDGMIRFEPLLERVRELGQPAVAITDHGTMGGFYQWYKAQNECEDINGIMGIEFYVVPDMEEKERRQNWHLVALAKDKKGIKNLFKLSTLAHVDGFYYKPRLDLQTLALHAEGLIIMSACVDGIIGRNIFEKDWEKASKNIEWFKSIWGEDFYIELQPHGFQEQKDINPELVNLAKEHKVKMVGTNDAHYLMKEDADSHEVWLCMQTNGKINDPTHFAFTGTGYYIKSKKEMFDTFKENHPWMSDKFINEILTNTVEVAGKCHFDIDKYENISPTIDTKGMTDREYLRHLCTLGWKKKLTKDYVTKIAEEKSMTSKELKDIYKNRVEHELEEIERLDFIKYFLVVWDLYHWAGRQGIMCGPARGSSAGSLVCYLLGIVQVDPIKYNLIFERFIAPDRITSPDIDMDFQDNRREEIKQYLRDKYGYVCDIGTFGRLKGKSSVKDVARVFDVPYPEVNAVTDLIIERSSGDARKSATVEDSFNEFKELGKFGEKYPEVKRHAIKLEGTIKQVSIHAAGVALSPFPLEEVVPLEKRSKQIVSAVDGKDCDELGLLKLDLLGLDTLTIMNSTLHMIEERTGRKIDPNKDIPLDDPKVIEKFAKGDVTGVFQFDGIGQSAMLREAPVENFNDIVALNALYRPGGMRSGLSAIYLKRRKGKEFKGMHPIYDEITKDTLGVIVYQEQVMFIFGRMAGYDAINVDRTRRAVAKSHGVEELERQRPVFVAGCSERGVPENISNKLFDNIAHFGSYGFNKSHAVSYTLLSYWGQWFRTYYPMEYYTSLLNFEDDKDKTKSFVKRIREEGIDVLPPSVNYSKGDFSIEGEAIRSGLKQVKKLGGASVPSIVDNQPYESFEDFIEKVDRSKVRKDVIENLIKSGAFKEMYDNTAQLLYDFEQMNAKKKDRDDPPKEIKPWKAEKEMKIAADVFPLPFKEHPIKFYKELLSKLDKRIEFTDASSIDWNDPGLYEVRKIIYMKGQIVEVKYNRIGDFTIGDKTDEEKAKMKYRWGSRYANCNLEDETGIQRIKFAPPEYEKYENMITKGKGAIVVIKGKMHPMYKLVNVEDCIDLTAMRERIENGEELLPEEKDLLEHPFEQYQETIDELKLDKIEDIIGNNKARTYGRVSLIFEYESKSGTMAFVDIDGIDAYVEAAIFADMYTKYKKDIKEGNIIAFKMVKSATGRWGISSKEKCKIESLESLKRRIEADKAI